MTETVKVTPDWERIEGDYRAGVLSLREIAEKDGRVTEGAIRKRAKKLAWPRDLGARIHAKAEELVRKEAVRTDGTQLKTRTAVAEREIIESNASAIASVKLGHRSYTDRSRKMFLSLLEELEGVSAERGALEELADALYRLQAPDSPKAADKAREILARAISLPARISSFKALTDALKTVVGIEREAWGLKADESPTTADAPIIGFGYENGGPGEPDPSTEGS